MSDYFVHDYYYYSAKTGAINDEILINLKYINNMVMIA